MSLRRWYARTGNRIGVRLYRRFDGRLSSRGDHGVLLLTVPGRRTGAPRSACVRYLDLPEGMLVWGTGSGAPRDPDWFRNLRAADRVEVQVRDRRCSARPRELLGAERDRVWADVVLQHAPEVQRYARRAGRPIPVAVLVPEPPGSTGARA